MLLLLLLNLSEDLLLELGMEIVVRRQQRGGAAGAELLMESIRIGLEVV